MKQHVVSLERVKKQLKGGKIPAQVRAKLTQWVVSVETLGLEATRVIPGFHDEPIQGRTDGSRSVRLNIQWRLFYTTLPTAQMVVVEIRKVTPHDYRKK